LSTPVNEQYACKSLAERAAGYGMKSVTIDGNNILEVYETFRNIAQEIRQNPEPWLVECVTFRMRGHEEASGVKYVPKELMDEWATKDPIQNYEHFLFENKILDISKKEEILAGLKHEINVSWQQTEQEPDVESSEEEELKDVYVPYTQN